MCDVCLELCKFYFNCCIILAEQDKVFLGSRLNVHLVELLKTFLLSLLGGIFLVFSTIKELEKLCCLICLFTMIALYQIPMRIDEYETKKQLHCTFFSSNLKEMVRCLFHLCCFSILFL